jgi:hypothetical protein
MERRKGLRKVIFILFIDMYDIFTIYTIYTIYTIFTIIFTKEQIYNLLSTFFRFPDIEKEVLNNISRYNNFE